MGSYLVRIKVLPTGPELPAQTLIESVKANLESVMSVKSYKEEPIAFGLYALIIDVVTPEEDGMVDKVEKAVSTAGGVAQYELIGVSRLSSQLKNL